MCDALTVVSKPEGRRPDMADPDWLRLLYAQEHALRALHQLFDVSYLALVAASSKAGPRPGSTKYNHEWLSASHPTVRTTLWSEIKPVYEDVANLVNRMKHTGSTLSPILFNSALGRLPAYYMQGVSWKPGIGPSPPCNPHATAFSFGRDLRLRILQYAWLDNAVARAADSIVKETGQSVQAPDPSFTRSQAGWESILDLASALPAHVLPDEAKKPFPVVKREGGRRKPYFVIETRERAGRYLGLGEVTYVGSGDDVTKHGQLLYPASEEGQWDLEASM